MIDADGVQLRSRIDEALAAFFATTRPALEDVSPDLAPAAQAVQEFVLDGGKRLRPAFCYWGWAGAGGQDPDDAIIVASAALELLQACALIHDDLMDRSDTRRGRPSIHRAFESHHIGHDLGGSAARFGEAAAVLLGDLCLVWANQMLDASGFDAHALFRARPTFSTMCGEVMAGQYLDVVEQTALDSDLDRALRVVRFKTAKYTVERPLHLGAALRGTDESVLAAYSSYGLPLGEAFQLRDDVLGVFGDPEQTGKPAGDDIREGKRTVLVAAAMKRGTEADRATLSALLGNPDLDDAGVTTAREIITSSGALDFAEKLMDTRMTEALNAIESAPVNESARQALTRLAEAVVRRAV